jgi:hypothetical protein
MIISAAYNFRRPKRKSVGGSSAAPIIDPTRYQLFGPRFTMYNAASSLPAAEKFMIAELVTYLPAPATNLRLGFIGFYNVQSGGFGSSVVEFNIGAAQNVEGLMYSSDDGSSYHPITLAGATSFVVPDGSTGMWTDPIAATLPAGKLRIQIVSNTASKRGTFLIMCGRNGEKAAWGSTSQLALLGTNFPGAYMSPTNREYSYGPSMAVAQFGDTLSASVLLGTSLEYGLTQTDQSADARGNANYIGIGMDDATGGRALYARMAFPSAYMHDIDGARLSKRKAFLDSAKAFNVNGQEVFDSVIIAHNINDNYASQANFTYSLDTQYTQALAERVGYIQTTISNIKALWPTVRVVACTTPYQMIDTVVANRYTDPAAMTIRPALGAGSNLVNAAQYRVDLRAAILGGLGQNGTIDLEGAVHDSNGIFKMTGAYSGTLVGATAANATSFVVTGSPPLDSLLVLEPGDGTNNNVFLASSVVDNGDGTSTVSNPYLSTNNSLPLAHAAGVVVKEARTKDGLHYNHVLASIGSAAVIAAKQAGAFR